MKLLTALDFSNIPATNVPVPTQGSHIANKQYVDDKQAGLSWKQEVRLATAAALPANTRVGNVLTANANGAMPAVDGVAPAVNDRILVKNEAAGANNGFYDVTSLGGAGAPWVLTRSADADTSAKMTPDAAMFVSEGATNADTRWTLTTDGPINLNVTALTFVQWGGGLTIVGGAGMTLTGNTLDVGQGTGIVVNANDVAIDPTVVARKFTALIGNGAATAIGVAHNLGNQYVLVQVFDAATNAQVFADVVLTDANTVTITFANAPANNSIRVVVIG